ncbi:MAG: YgfZ/GcvT domain-containing protein [Micrococcales bacterium]
MPLLQNPLTAQVKILDGSALVDLPDLAVISVSGTDRLAWLHSLLSQNLRNLQPGQSVEALALDANGHVEAIVRCIDDGETTRLIVDSTSFVAVFDWLRKMVFRSKVVVNDDRDSFAFVGSWLTPLSHVTPAFSWTDGWSQTVQGGYRYGAAPTEPWALVLNAISREIHAALLSDPAQNWAPTDALDALRINAHRPALAEVDEKTIPHELDLLASAVHLSKGCYRGQETVAKVHNLGHPPRRLVLLHLDGSNHLLPEVGNAVVVGFGSAEERVVGRVTSAANHFEAGPIALAVVSRNTPIDAQLTVIGNHEPVAASQEVIVPQDAGKVANIPRAGLLAKPRRP